MEFYRGLICFGNGPESSPNCATCGCRVECLDKKSGWGLGTLLAVKERFDLVFFALTANFSEDEIEILEEMLESGGYSASTYADYVCGAGVIPDPKQLEAESRMEEKQREYLEGLKLQHPKIWEVYQHLLSATEPGDVKLN